MANRSFNPSYTGIGELLKSPQMVAAMHAVAEKVLARAKAIAPVDTGRYKASLSVSAGVDGDRAHGVITADVPYAWYVEYGNGTAQSQGYRVLGRALDGI